MTSAIQKVKISNKEVLYKNGEPANSIELISFEFEDGSPCGYNIVSQKDIHEIGNYAYYIQPDFCVSDNSLFESFISPMGDPKKSRLGKNNRIRAIK